MTQTLRVTSIITLSVLMVISSFLPYIPVSAGGLNSMQFEMSSVVLEPGEGVFIKRNTENSDPSLHHWACSARSSKEDWEYKINLTSLGGELDYAFVTNLYGNKLNSNGDRVFDFVYDSTGDYSKGGTVYQKHMTKSSLTYFDGEVLNVTNTSDYPLKLEWVKEGEHDHLISEYDKKNYNARDCGLAAENIGVPAYTEYTIQPNETYLFKEKPLSSRDRDRVYLEETQDSVIFPMHYTRYTLMPIESNGEMKFDVAIQSQTYKTSLAGYRVDEVSETPVVISDAQERFGLWKDGRYYISWSRNSDATRTQKMNGDYLLSLRLKNTGDKALTVTIPFDIMTGEKVDSIEPYYRIITLKPKERLTYEVLNPGNLNAPEITILGSMYEDNFVSWGRRDYNGTSEKIIGFKNFHTLGVYDRPIVTDYLTNVSNQDLKIAYPVDYIKLKKVPVYEDVTLISTSLQSNRFSQYYSASGDLESLISDPIDTSTGAFTSVLDTLSTRGVTELRMPLRYYTAFTTEGGIFGKGWETEYTATLTGHSGLKKIKWSQNRYNDYVLIPGTTNEYVGVDEATKNDRLTVTNHNYHAGVLEKKDGSKWVFYNNNLIELTDRLGRTITLEREGRQLKYIKDKATGERLTLNYEDSYSSSKVTEIKDSLGRRVKFTYTNGLLSSFTDPEGEVTTYTYDENGRILTSSDNEGKLLFVNTYDDKGRVIKQENNGVTLFNYTLDEETGNQTTEVTDRKGNTKQLVHSPDLKLIKVRDENGNSTEKFYDSEGNLIKSLDENGSSTTFTHDVRGNIVTSTNAAGVVTRYTYDDSDNLTSVTLADKLTSQFVYENNLLEESQDSKGNKTSYTYNSDGQIETLTAPNNGVTTYQYDRGLLKTITDPTGVITNYEHDKTGRLTATIDADGNRTELSYDKNSNLIATKDALGNIITFTYDSRNRKTTETDSKGNTTKYTYDDNNNLKTVTDADGNTATNDYDEEDRLIKTSDLRGNVTEFILDNLGQIIAVKDPLGNTVSMEYDKVGNITATKDAYGITTNQTVYDSLSRPTKSTDSLGNTSIIKYNQWSDVTVSVNALNQTTQFNYYDIGLVSRVTDANSGVTEQSYDNMTQQSSFTDANGNTTSFSYDKAGRTTSISLQNGASIRYEYNNKGYLSKTTNARGQAFNYEYDKLGRLTKTTKPDGIATTTYDTNGNVLTKSDENGTVTFTYDKLNRPTSYTDVYGNRLGYTYDLNSNLTQLEYPDGKVVKYTYNANNQLIKVVDWNNRQTEYAYDKNGRLTSTQRSNGTSENRVYDTKGQLTSLSEQATNGLTVRQTIFTYDALGNITSEETTGIGQESRVYAYDKLNRVTNSTNSLKDNSYIYDKQGNILSILSHNLAPTTTVDSATVVSTDTATITSEDSVTITSTEDSALIELGYGDNNWLTSINSQPITYDADGNALQTLLNGDLVSLEYDSLNRLVRSGTTSYRYDVNNNRIEVQDQNDTTQFVVNPLSQYSQVLVETDETGRILKRYIYGIGLIGEETLDNNYITYHYDYRGSTVFLTDEQGEVTVEFKYDTYGELLSPQEGYRFLYNGRDGVETDLNGLYYMRARYYNPDIKRFVNQDILLGSIGDSTSLNRYAYVNGNPVSLIDPFGLESENSSISFLDSYIYSRVISDPVLSSVFEIYTTVEDFNKKDYTSSIFLASSFLPPSKAVGVIGKAGRTGKQLSSLKSYLRDIEKMTGVKISSSQRALLKEDLKSNSYSKLGATEKKSHRYQFSKDKDKLISQWESQTGHTWGTYTSNVYSKSGSILRKPGDKYDAHEIIPNSYGGPLEWYNIHPARYPDQHQGGIHRKDGVFRTLFK